MGVKFALDRGQRIPREKRHDYWRCGYMSLPYTSFQKKMGIQLKSKRSLKKKLQWTTLKLDIDSKDVGHLKANRQAIEWVMETLGFTLLGVRTYKTRRGCHRLVRIAESLSPLEIVAVQCLCGSDLRRETFNMARVLMLPSAPAFWHNRWNVLYREKL
jgi:hypothetical protein